MSAEFPRPIEQIPVETLVASLATPGYAFLLDNDTLGARPSAELPTGFSYADQVTCRDLSTLQNSVAVFGHTSESVVYAHQLERRHRAERLIGVGVRSDYDARLVGYGLLVIEPKWTGRLCDFMVHPKVRSRGIGKAIVDERIAQADRLRLGSVDVEIGDTNTLRSYYYRHGFQQHDRPNVLRRVLGGVAQSTI